MVVVVIGAGSIGQACARRVSAGRRVLLVDLNAGNVAALLMGPEGRFITGSDFLMDGGVTASYWFGEFAPQ